MRGALLALVLAIIVGGTGGTVHAAEVKIDGSEKGEVILGRDDTGITYGGLVETFSAASCPFPGANGSYHRATYHVTHRNLANVVVWRISLRGESCVNWKGKISAYRFNKSKWVNPDPTNDWVWRQWTDFPERRRDRDGLRLAQGERAPTAVLVVDIGINCWKDAYPWVNVHMMSVWPWSWGKIDKRM